MRFLVNNRTRKMEDITVETTRSINPNKLLIPLLDGFKQTFNKKIPRAKVKPRIYTINSKKLLEQGDGRNDKRIMAQQYDNFPKKERKGNPQTSFEVIKIKFNLTYRRMINSSSNTGY